ncbi:MAG: hypothetical protein WC635_14150 [Bacteriovorax sp.]|jgi:hypothetical protein
MKNSFLILVLLPLLFIGGCSSKGKGTPTKFKLKVASLTGTVNGIAISDGVLYGRSDLGAFFAHKINTSSETLDMPNGNWTFHAFIWDAANGATAMNGNIYCATTTAALAGTDVNLSLTLNNANCSSPAFSDGKTYLDTQTPTAFYRFAEFFFEDCDVVPTAPDYACGLKNMGNALSYKVVFQEYSSGFAPASGFIDSYCVAVGTGSPDVFGFSSKGLPVNFPSGPGFGVSVKMYMNNSCNDADPKGVRVVGFPNGIGAQNGANDKVLFSSTSCADLLVTTTPAGIESCKEVLGTPGTPANGCGSNLPIINRFTPTCNTTTSAVNSSIKHIVAPAAVADLCAPYINLSSAIGAHPFAAGDGTSVRPYKICTEWQLNQIGELLAPVNYKTSSYKLMNNLDMNKTDFIAGYAKPYCMTSAGDTGATATCSNNTDITQATCETNGAEWLTGSLVGDHHNLNSLDGIFEADCGMFNPTTGFTGSFNGNGKTIFNGRIIAQSVNKLGFVRTLNGGSVYDLNFKNFEVRGNGIIGGIAGEATVGSVTNTIKNININALDIESNGSGSYVGGIIGQGFGTSNQTILSKVQVKKARIRGVGYVGGLVGSNFGTITGSSFVGTIDQSNSSGNFVGGLVGQNNSGVIDQSFSEGLINSQVLNVGGIAGDHLAGGTISSVYSTMVIASNYMTAANVGGIAGQSAGTISDAFFSGNLVATGSGTTASFGAIIGAGNGVTNSWSDRPLGVAGSALAYGQLRDSTYATMTLTPAFVRTTGSVPRLAWEVRECLNASNNGAFNIQAGIGSAIAPYIICNLTQLSAINGSTLYYRLGDSINLADGTFNTNSPIASFGGTLDGAGNMLYGVNMTVAYNASPTLNGIFQELSVGGVLKNLFVAGNELYLGAQTLAVGNGVLVGKNLGTISNVTLAGNRIDGYSSVGLLAGINPSGTISDIDVKYGNKMSGFQNVGGVVGNNGGSLLRVESHAEILNKTTETLFEIFGGVAGYNSGSLEQTRFGGRIMMNAWSGATGGIRIGGLVGKNTGTINNSYTDNYSEISSMNDNIVGGLIGEMVSGSIAKSFALGKVIFSNAGAIMIGATTFNPIVGSNVGGTIVGSTYYLEKNIGSLVANAMTSGTCTNGSTVSCTTSPSYNHINADFFNLSYGSGGDKLTTMVPFTKLNLVGDLTASSAVISTTNTAGIMPGMVCTGAGINPGSTVSSFTPNVSITLNIPVGGAGTFVPITCVEATSTTFNFLLVDNDNKLLPSGTSINFFGGHIPNSTTGQQTKANMAVLSTFCTGGFTGTAGNEVCSSGYDIAGIDAAPSDYGYNRLLAYYNAVMNDTAVPANTPIWELDHEGSPRLLQLEHH